MSYLVYPTLKPTIVDTELLEMLKMNGGIYENEPTLGRAFM
ncbi:hypothetical protein [Terribacillus saccharophilus]|nr:hypothetical protein [Terribacillus saccharophilus]